MLDRLFAFDIETAGVHPNYALQPWRVRSNEAWIRCFAVATQKGDDGMILDGKSKEYIARKLYRLVEHVLQSNYVLVCWNAVFELSWLAAYGVPKSLLYQLKVIDGMVLMKHVYNYASFYNEPKKVTSYGLKEAVRLFFPDEAGYETDIEFEGDINKLYEYNKKDAVFTYKIVAHLLRTQSLGKVVVYEAQALPLFGYALAMGLPVNVSALDALSASVDATLAEIVERLYTYGLTEKIINSPKQLATFLFDTCGLAVTSFDRAVHKFAISELYDRAVKQNDEKTKAMLHDIIQYKELITKRRKFVEAAKKSIAYIQAPRIHPYPLLFGTYSGRVTYSATVGSGKQRRYVSWALHQTQRDKDVRALLCAPPGYMIVEFDAAGQEYRWMAVMSQDCTMIDLCNAGKDPHAHMGNIIYNVENIDKLSYDEFMQQLHDGNADIKYYRQLGKIVNLSCQYRIGAVKLRNIARVQYNVPLNQDEANSLLDTYKSTYAGVTKYWSKQANLAAQSGFITTLAGRRVLLPSRAALRSDASLRWQAESAAINFPIQGIGADQKYYALAQLRQVLVDYDAWFAFDLHDGIYIFAPEDRVEDFIKAALNVLNNLSYKPLIGREPEVKMMFDCKYGKTWGELKSWESV